MFRKYFSHEFKNTCQMPLTICGIIIAISILFCIGAIFELEFLLTLGIVSIVVSAYVCAIMSYIVIHKTLTGRLFTKSGYLTLTLPVGTHTILISKILVNFIYAACYVVSFIIGIFFVLGGFGLLDDVGAVARELIDVFVSLFKNFDLVLIYSVQSLIGFVFLLCFILFCNAFSNSGYLKKQNKVLKFIMFIAFMIAVTYVMTIRIVPFSLVKNYDNSYQILSTKAIDILFEGFVVLDFSVFLWTILGTLGFYFGSYYLIKNKIDIL